MDHLLKFKKGIKSSCRFAVLLIFIVSCKKDKVPEFDPGTNGFVNKWVLDSMKVYYYWNNTLPEKPDYNQEPLKFFAALKNGADRFSRLLNPELRESYPHTLYDDFGIDLITITTGGVAQTLVRLVVPGSDGDLAGLKRGDRVLRIDGTTVTSSNIGSLSEASLEKSSITLQIEGKTAAYKIDGYLKPDPVYITKVWERGGKKIGYILLNSFDIKALPTLKEVFAGFQAAQINELILDIRYNTGGEVSVAAALAAMISKANENDIFLEYRGNRQAGTQRHSFGVEIAKVFAPLSYGQYTNLRLNINRIFILTGTHTASAAELLTNNLPPYITTTRIGEQTLGKDMASFDISDRRNPKLVHDWMIVPLVFKVYNAQGKGDYSAGLIPDISADELDNLPLKQLGDPEETLTKLAISQITGLTISARTLAVSKGNTIKMYDARDKEDAFATTLRVIR